MTFLKSTTLGLVFVTGTAFAGSHAQPGDQFMTVWDMDGDGTATLAELQDMRATVFGMFDADENGVIDAGEYVAFDDTRNADMENFQGPEPARAMMQMVADGLGLAPNDADQDGSVSRDEFVAGTQTWLEQIDQTGDGAVTSADFMR